MKLLAGVALTLTCVIVSVRQVNSSACFPKDTPPIRARIEPGIECWQLDGYQKVRHFCEPRTNGGGTAEWPASSGSQCWHYQGNDDEFNVKLYKGESLFVRIHMDNEPLEFAGF
jgi:hypothetical protein